MRVVALTGLLDEQEDRVGASSGGREAEQQGGRRRGLAGRGRASRRGAGTGGGRRWRGAGRGGARLMIFCLHFSTVNFPCFVIGPQLLA